MKQRQVLYKIADFLLLSVIVIEAAPHQGVLFVVGPDSPSTVMKDVNTHTRVMKLKQQALEDRLKMCLLELKKLCIREAVSYCSHSLLHQNTPEERQGSFIQELEGTSTAC